jgi:TniQ
MNPAGQPADTLSPLPRSLDPLPDESLPGYLLRLAHRPGLTPARIMQLTGLTASRDGHQLARRSLTLHLDEAPAAAFASITRLTAAEVAGLCMASMSGRYPWAAPRVTADQWGPRSLAGPWVFTSATRYCPQCLAGDGSPIQQQHGGAWQKAWRLPVVFACPVHRRLLEHLCPSCRQPAMSAAPGAPVWLIPRAFDAGLHPAQCRAALPPQAAGRHTRPCGARLDAPARAREDFLIPDDLLAVQDRLLQLLGHGEPANVRSVGQPATPARYFADLRLVCSLINGAWPHSRNLITGPGMAECLGRHIASTSGAAPRRHTLCDAPPLAPQPAAALITAAVRILDGSDLRVLGEFLAPSRDGASRKSPRGRWLRRYQRAGHGCSGGFRDALEPLIGSFQRTDRRARGRRAPAPEAAFAPEHIPEHLQDDWYDQHFRHIGGNTRLLRRAAALRLVQMSAGGSLAEAAAFLGIDHRYLKASPGSAAFTDDPAEFRLAIHALARQLSTTPGLISYKHRMDALRNWCIDPRHGRTSSASSPRQKDRSSPSSATANASSPPKPSGRASPRASTSWHPGSSRARCQQATPHGTGAATTCGTSTTPARSNRTTPPSGKSSARTPMPSPRSSTASRILPRSPPALQRRPGRAWVPAGRGGACRAPDILIP